LQQFLQNSWRSSVDNWRDLLKYCPAIEGGDRHPSIFSNAWQ
jgi:hypothetical protein